MRIFKMILGASILAIFLAFGNVTLVEASWLSNTFNKIKSTFGNQEDIDKESKNTKALIAGFTILGADTGSNGKIRTIDSGDSVELVLNVNKTVVSGGAKRDSYLSITCIVRGNNAKWSEKLIDSNTYKFASQKIYQDVDVVINCKEYNNVATVVREETATVAVKVRNAVVDEPVVVDDTGYVSVFTILGADKGSGGKTRTIDAGDSVEIRAEFTLKLKKRPYPKCTIRSSDGAFVEAKNMVNGRTVTTHKIYKDTTFSVNCESKGDRVGETKTVAVKVRNAVAEETVADTSPGMLIKSFTILGADKGSGGKIRTIDSGDSVEFNLSVAQSDVWCKITDKDGGNLWYDGARANSIHKKSSGKIYKDTTFSAACMKSRGIKILFEPSDELTRQTKTVTVKVRNAVADESPVTTELAPLIVQINKFSIVGADSDSDGSKKTVKRGETVKLNVDYLVEINPSKNQMTGSPSGRCYLMATNPPRELKEYIRIFSGSASKGHKYDEVYTTPPIYKTTDFTLMCAFADKQVRKTVKVLVGLSDDDAVIDNDNNDDSSSDDETATDKKAELSVDFSAGDGTDTQTVAKGGVAKFVVVIKNTGDVNLKNLSVQSYTAVNCVRNSTQLVKLYDGSELDPGEELMYSCQKDNVTNGYAQSISISGVRVDNDKAIEVVKDETMIVVESNNNDQDNQDDNADDNDQNDEAGDDDNVTTTCTAPTVATALENSSLVFTGVVKSTSKTYISKFFGYEQKVVVTIGANDMVYKGSSRSEVVLRVKDGSLLQVGERYLIYAKRTVGAFGFTTSGCARTKSYDSAAAEIEQIKEILNPVSDDAMIVFIKSSDGDSEELLADRIDVGSGEVTLMAVGENVENCQLVQEKNGKEVTYEAKNSDVTELTNTKQLMMYVLDIDGDGAQMTIKCTGTTNSSSAGKVVSDSVHLVVSDESNNTTDGYDKDASVVFISGLDDDLQPIVQADMTVVSGSEVNLQWVGHNVEQCVLTQQEIAAKNQRKLRTFAGIVTIKDVAKLGSHSVIVDSNVKYILKCVGSSNSDKPAQEITSSVKVYLGSEVEAENSKKKNKEAVTDSGYQGLTAQELAAKNKPKDLRSGSQFTKCDSGSRNIKGFAQAGGAMSISCKKDQVRVAVTGSNKRYIWKTAYLTENGKSFTKTLQLNGKTDSSGKWIVGAASVTTSYNNLSKGEQAEYVAVYACALNGSKWECGCSGDACNEPGGAKWSIMPFNYQK